MHSIQRVKNGDPRPKSILENFKNNSQMQKKRKPLKLSNFIDNCIDNVKQKRNNSN